MYHSAIFVFRLFFWGGKCGYKAGDAHIVAWVGGGLGAILYCNFRISEMVFLQWAPSGKRCARRVGTGFIPAHPPTLLRTLYIGRRSTIIDLKKLRRRRGTQLFVP